MAVKFNSKATVEIVEFGTGPKPELQSKELLGGKGANLVEMANMGFQVPPGFVIPCAASIKYTKSNSSLSQSLMLTALWAEVETGMATLRDHFGYTPLVSVRSGARVSMPGMMDTILNVGLTSDTLPLWSEMLGERAAKDSYRRLLQMYGSVVFEIDMAKFDHALEVVKKAANVEVDSDLDANDLNWVIEKYLEVFLDAGYTMPDTIADQVHGAIKAVFRSWDNPRAVEYRKIHGIPDNWGTAVTVQSMVFGNLNDNSATGVLFTRCPSTGHEDIVGEFLVNAQGEDVVAGIRTPEPLAKMHEWNPELATSLFEKVRELEAHYRDMQDVEFTIQDGKLYILQTRSGKRSPHSAFKVAVDLVEEGLISPAEAVGRVTQKQLLAMTQDTIDPSFDTPPTLTGIAAGGGLVTGVAVFSSEAAINCKVPCILVRKETDPDDIGGMNASVGILTATGGLTSHAAVVARGMNKTCVVGCTNMDWQENPPKATIGTGIDAFQFTEGCKITMDGATGKVWAVVDVPVIAGGKSHYVLRLLSWALESMPERVTLPATGFAEWHKVLAETTAKSVYVDTALLEPAVINSSTEVESAYTGMALPLMSCSAEEITLDLTPASDFGDGNDDLLATLVAPKVSSAKIMEAKAGIIAAYPPELKAKLVVVLPTSDQVASNILLSAGVQISSPVATVADLLATSGSVRITQDVIKSVFGGQAAFDTLCAMVEAQKGIKLSGAAPVYWYETLNKAN